ncbi:MAG: hypothetical protein ACYDGM_00115 [Vulcanimicrobiaceae bacterium]
MIRYFAIAAIIVLAVAVIATAYSARELIRIRIASVNVTMSPKAGEAIPTSPAKAPPFIGDAPWALSALPECLIQTQRSRGSIGYVRSRLPAGARRIVPPAQLRYGDCTIFVSGDEAYVRRGHDRFRIPPDASFYRVGNRLALLRIVGRSADLRIYQRSKLTNL